MSHALAVSHGAFGRAALYDLDRPITTHAHREGHLIFYISGDPAAVDICGARNRCDPQHAAAVSPWEPHSFQPDGGSCLCMVLYIKPMWFLEQSGSADFALKFGRRELPVTASIAAALRQLTALMLTDSTSLEVEGHLISLTTECYDESWARRGQPLSLDRSDFFSDFRVRKSQRLMKDYLHDHNGLDRLGLRGRPVAAPFL